MNIVDYHSSRTSIKRRTVRIKGIGKVTAVVPAAAIASAINDAIDIWINEMPITPKKILRALARKEKSSLENGK